MAALNEDSLSDNVEQQVEEFESLSSIYNEDMIVIVPGKEYMINIGIYSNESLELLLKTANDIPPTSLEGSLAPPTLLPRATSTQPVQVYHLPPVTIYIRYHDDYPSQKCPHFHLTARWLNKRHTETICDRLHSLFTPGIPVVYNWMTYIDTDLISEYSQLQLETERGHPSNQLFVRSISEFNDVEEYNCYESHKQFLSEKHDCVICFETKFGDQFCDPCTSCISIGLFCKGCVREHCQTLLAEGRVTSMSCLNTDCSRLLPDALVKSLLTEEQFQKFLHMREEVSLDSIPGMVFCPRTACCSRSISEPNSDLAVCSQCSFPFCKLCRQTWHGIEKCSIFDKVLTAETDENEGEESSGKSMSSEQTQRRIEELKSVIWMRSHRNVSQCPKCTTLIQKIGGCNRMTCWKCGSSFCWLCGEPIAGYGHFDTRKCELFRNEDYLPSKEEKDGHDASANIPKQDEVSVLENLLESVCPRCGLIHQKTRNNNWVRCTKCQLPFCLQCREPCYGRYHFSEYGCKEFSTLLQDVANHDE